MKRFITLLMLGSMLSFNYISAQTAVWGQLGSDIDGVAADDRSGYSTSINGDGTIVAIGAPGNDGNGGSSGSVTIYHYDDSSWQQSGNTIYGDSGDKSGYSVSLSDDGKIVAIGAISNGGGGWQKGTVRIYQYDNNSSTWSQLGSNINGESGNDLSGNSVCLSSDGMVVAIGADNNDGNDGNYYNSGHVRIFKYLSNAWQQIGTEIDGDAPENYFGTSVSLSDDGTVLAVGAIKHDDNANDAGQVKIFKYDGAIWKQMGADIYGKNTYEYAGTSVSLSSDGNTVAIGAPRTGSQFKGQVYIYKYDGSAWSQLGNDIVGETNSDANGQSVSISSDGSIVAIGAPQDPGGDNNNGRAYVYKFNVSTSGWELIADVINGEASNDLSGSSVCISNNGSAVAIGAPYNDGGNNTNSGHVRVFELTTTTRVEKVNQNDILIYPNPTTGVLNIRSKENIKQIIISNITGKTILTNSNVNQTTPIDLSGIKNGIYIITIKTDSGIINKKLIKN